MNSTDPHPFSDRTGAATGKPWIGFDLDGTLAVYDKWEGIDHIGEPVKPMVDLIRRLHREGKVVKILTVRVAPRADADYRYRVRCNPPDYVENADFTGLVPGAKTWTWVENMYLGLDKWGAMEFVADWCLKNLGFLPEITHEKDHLMVTLYDDRVKQVVPNDGSLVEDIARGAFDSLRKCESELGWATIRANNRFIGLGSGLLAGYMLAMLSFAAYEGFKAWRQRDNEVYQRTEEVRSAAKRLLEVLPAPVSSDSSEVSVK